MAYGENGYLDFDKLWKLLEKKNLKQQYLINNGIHRNTVYKLKNNDNITSEVICNLCKLLNCQPKDILEYIPNQKNQNASNKSRTTANRSRAHHKPQKAAKKTEDDKTIIEYAKAENNDSDECPF